MKGVKERLRKGPGGRLPEAQAGRAGRAQSVRIGETTRPPSPVQGRSRGAWASHLPPPGDSRWGLGAGVWTRRHRLPPPSPGAPRLADNYEVTR